MERGRLGYVFLAAVGPGEATGADPPDGAAVEAAVVAMIILLQTLGAALWADAAFV